MYLSVASVAAVSVRSVTVKCYAAAAMYLSVAADTFWSYFSVLVYEQESGEHVK
jgi:hypothetical protein